MLYMTCRVIPEIYNDIQVRSSMNKSILRILKTVVLPVHLHWNCRSRFIKSDYFCKCGCGRQRSCFSAEFHSLLSIWYFKTWPNEIGQFLHYFLFVLFLNSGDLYNYHEYICCFLVTFWSVKYKNWVIVCWDDVRWDHLSFCVFQITFWSLGWLNGIIHSKSWCHNFKI